VLCEAFGDTKREVFEKLTNEFKDAHEIRIKTLNNLEGATTEMPRYRCHKDVWALKIRDISDPTQPGNESDGSRLLWFVEQGYAARRVGAAYVRKHEPKAGGYFVVYKDGYESFSPADVFEEGYSRA
jgi:hypothetical protein